MQASSTDKSNNSFQKTWFIVPDRIMKLEGMTITLLRFYETIFEFWNNGQKCFLSNSMIMERTGIKSNSTLQEAFNYFDSHGEMKRVQKGSKRFIVKPEPSLSDETTDFPEEGGSSNEPVGNSHKNSTKNSQGVATATGGCRTSDMKGVATATHNNNKLNINNIKKSFCNYDEHKKRKAENAKRHAWADKYKPLQKQTPISSTSEKPSTGYRVQDVPRSSPEVASAWIDKMFPNRKRKNVGVKNNAL